MPVFLLQTKKNAVKSGIEQWIRWESETLNKLQQAQLDLYDEGEVASALFINHFIKRTQHELKCAKRKHLELSAVEFDMDFILSEQKEIHDKYKSML